jgi:hypothetical protein
MRGGREKMNFGCGEHRQLTAAKCHIPGAVELHSAITA